MLTLRRDSPARRRRAPAPLLDGIRRADWAGRPAVARRLGAVLADRGEVAYCVGRPEENFGRERRADPLGALRTRSMRALDAARRRIADRLLGEPSIVRLMLLVADERGRLRRLVGRVEETVGLAEARAASRRGLPVGARPRDPPPARPVRSGALSR